MKAGSVLRPQGPTTKLSARLVEAVSESLLSECCFVFPVGFSVLFLWLPQSDFFPRAFTFD